MLLTDTVGARSLHCVEIVQHKGEDTATIGQPPVQVTHDSQFCHWLVDWQGHQGSNPRPTVLETVALPAELYPCGAGGICDGKIKIKTSFALLPGEEKTKKGRSV